MKGELTKQRIVESAAELFWSRSFHAVSVAEIAVAASVNKATVYQYFKSKEQLAYAVQKDNHEKTLALVFEKAFLSSTKPLQQLRAIYKNVHALQRAIYENSGNCRGCPFVNMATELGKEDEHIRELTKATFATFGEYYQKIIRSLRGPRLGKAREARLVRSLIGNMNGAMVAATYEQRPDAILDALPSAEILLNS